MDKFEIYDIEVTPEYYEQLGTKEKFWFYASSDKSDKWLLKYSRENTGEHWSEKIAEQLCELLLIPHVQYEFAECNGRIGVITKNVIAEGCRMVMGNEVLHALSPQWYPSPENNESVVRVKEHTVKRVMECLDSPKILPPDVFSGDAELNSGDVFCGYLMLDALISNQDRHHENWAIIVNNELNSLSLCPTYDHAASLGRELLDEERYDRLNTRDTNRQVHRFVSRATSELFKEKSDTKPLKTKDAFYYAMEGRKHAKDFWLSRLQSLSEKDVEDIVLRVPDRLISETAREFVVKMVFENKRRLLEDGTE